MVAISAPAPLYLSVNFFIYIKHKIKFIPKPHFFYLSIKFAGFQFIVQAYLPFIGVLKKSAYQF